MNSGKDANLKNLDFLCKKLDFNLILLIAALTNFFKNTTQKKGMKTYIF